MKVEVRQPVVVGIQSSATSDAIIAPILKNYPIFDDALKLFTIYFNVRKKKELTHLNPAKWLVQKGFDKAMSEAGTIKPLGTITHDKDSVSPEVFDIFYRVFPEELADTIEAIDRGAGNQYHKVDGDPNMTALLNAFITLLEITWGNNLYTMTFFSDKDFALPSGVVFDADSDVNTKIVEALSQFDGIWKNIESKVDDGKITHIDLEDWTQDKYSESADALVQGGASPVVIQDNDLPSDFDYDSFFEDIKTESSKELQQYGANQGIGEKPKFLVTPNVFRGYKKFLKKTYKTNWKGYQLMVKGRNDEQIPYGLEWDGHAVVEVPEWDTWYSMMGKDSHIRILFEAPQNLTIATDVNAVGGVGGQGGSGFSFVATERMETELIGAFDVRASFKMDTGIGSNVLITAAY